MQSWKRRIPSGVLVTLVLATPGMSAADAIVSGRAPHIRVHRHPMQRMDERPVFVVVDDFDAFHVGASPPLEIRVEGDVAVIALPDGTVLFLPRGEHETEGE